MVELKQKFEVATEAVVRAKIALEKAESERDSIYQQITGTAPIHAASSVVKIPKAPKGKALKILALLHSQPEKEWSYEEIEQKLPDIKKQSLRSFLFRLKKAQQIDRVGRGNWKMK